MPECYSCPHKLDVFGNYMQCELLSKQGIFFLIDWWYWNSGCPDECPLKDKATEEKKE